jgi:membrane protein YqaA with SNARE-associated domain
MSSRWLLIARILALIIVIAISAYVYSIRDQADRFAAYGYPGIFFIAFLSYATVILPAPGIAVVFTMGAIFNPFWVALSAGAGAALGELSGYLAGFSGQAVIERSSVYTRFSSWMRKNGPLTVLVLSAVPNPLFDIAGVAAGALKMPLRRFLFWCWLGETIKMLALAYLGERLLRFFSL